MFTAGKGVWVYDENGRPFLEALAGMRCTSLGFGDVELIEAAVEQLRVAILSYRWKQIGSSQH